MKIAESYSVIVIQKDKAAICRWHVSKGGILGALAAGVALALFVLAVSLGLVHYRGEVVTAQDLLHRGKYYERERVQLLAHLNELEKVMHEQEKLAGRLETIVGIHDPKGIQAGVGGAEPERNPESPFHFASLLEEPGEGFNNEILKAYHLKVIDMKEEAHDVGGRLKKVLDFQPDAVYFWTSAPTTTPLNGWMTSDFGMRRSPVHGGRQFHQGIDIASPFGSPVLATGDGVVTYAGRAGGLGKKVVIDHSYGISTVYGHNSKLLVQVGDLIKRGQLIAKVGSTGRSTGPHLHYEILVDGIPVNPKKFILEEF